MQKRKTDRRIIKTRRAITNSLLQLLSKEDIDEITITALTQLADINRKTFYLHYSGVEEVSKEIQDNIYACISGLAYASVKDGVFDAGLFFDAIVEKAKETPELFRLLFVERTANYFVHAMGERVLKLMIELYRPSTSLEDRVLEYALTDILVGTVGTISCWATGQTLPVDQVFAVTRDLFVAGTQAIYSK